MSRNHPSPVRRPSLRTSTVISGVVVISVIVATLAGWVAELLSVFAFCSLAAAARVGVAIAATISWEEPVKKRDGLIPGFSSVSSWGRSPFPRLLTTSSGSLVGEVPV